MDSLLADDGNEAQNRNPRPRQRLSVKDSSRGAVEEERDSSLCRDVDKDPMMIEKLKKEREDK